MAGHWQSLHEVTDFKEGKKKKKKKKEKRITAMVARKQVIDAFKIKDFKHQPPELQFTTLCFYYSVSGKLLCLCR